MRAAGTRSRATSWRLVAFGGALVLLALAAAASLALGSHALPLGDVLAALGGHEGTYADRVVASRIPRTLTGLLAGACLAVAGVVMQGVTRNPLGDPGLFGVNLGAAAAVVTASAFLGIGGAPTVWVALPGALLAMAVVYAVGSGPSGATPVRLVLAGAVVTAVLTAYVQVVTLRLPEVFDSYRFWVVGSLAGSRTGDLVEVLPLALPALLVVLGSAGALNALALGDLTAAGLGAHPGRTRGVGLVAASVLSAVATAVAGPIAFIGLAVPHLVRAAVGSDHRWQLPFSLVLGPALLLAADVVGRLVIAPRELMVGVVTAFVGAPFLLAAVHRIRSIT